MLRTLNSCSHTALCSQTLFAHRTAKFLKKWCCYGVTELQIFLTCPNNHD